MMLGAERGSEVHAALALADAAVSGTRLLWMKNNAPDLFRQTAMALSVTDWLAFVLSGKMVAERSQAGETLFRSAKRSWAFDLIDLVGIRPVALRSPCTLARPSAVPRPSAGNDLGLVPGIPVAAGGADTQCGPPGAGAMKDGDLAVIAGNPLMPPVSNW